MENSMNNQPYRTLSMVLKSQSQLYDLHTHLLGMGNVGFWIDTIIMDEEITPTNDTFRSSEATRYRLCPLIWDKCNHAGFVNGKEAADFFQYLIGKNILPAKTLDEACQNIKENYQGNQELQDIFCKLCRTVSEDKPDDYFNTELQHYGLNFAENFSYDIILTLSDLAKGLGISEKDPDDFIQMKIADKLGIYLSRKEKKNENETTTTTIATSENEKEQEITFQHWIIFNAREQLFEVVYGIPVEDLRFLIKCDPNAPNEAKKIARAYINNAFSMFNPHGTSAENVDFHAFRGNFTPEFYPRRFALKDSLYSQRLDVLAALIHEVLQSYQACLPPVKYCEFSVGVGDLTRPWVYDILRSFPIPKKVDCSVQTEDEPPIDNAVKQNEVVQTNVNTPQPTTVHESGQTSNPSYPATDTCSSFSQCVADNHFPHLQVAMMGFIQGGQVVPCTANVVYKFLAGFDRKDVVDPLPENQRAALELLYESPQHAIQLMLQEIKYSADGHTSQAFSKLVNKLNRLQADLHQRPQFYHWVVGIDLFGDELGYPYCPFVADTFIKYINDRQKSDNDCFGVRIHCGENVLYADIDAPGYRSFIAHMYIVFRSLQFLQSKLEKGIRIGHGIAFERILGKSMSSLTHRKSCVLLAEMRHYAEYLFKNIAFEVNITSNEYLLGDILRQGDFAQTHRLDALFNLKAPIILATDDDGIWPIDRCSFGHRGHHSLAAEYCRAITSSIIKKSEQLEKILKDTRDFCFFNMGGTMPEKNQSQNVIQIDHNSICSIILHPNLIQAMLHRLKYKQHLDGEFHTYYYQSYPNIPDTYDDINKNLWNTQYRPVAQVAYIWFCRKYILNPHQLIYESGEYKALFDNDTDLRTFKYIDVILDKIDNEFMNLNIQKKDYRFVVLMSYNRFLNPNSASNNEPRKAFFGPSRNDEQSVVAFLQAHSRDAVPLDIQASDGKMDSKIIEHIVHEVQKNSTDFDNLSLTIYTNKDKNNYTYCKQGNLLKLQVNPNPNKWDTTKRRYLYALCPEAVPATAALDYIASQISTAPGISEDTIIGVQPVSLHTTEEPAF